MIENAANLQGVAVAMKLPSELIQSKVAADYAALAAAWRRTYIYLLGTQLTLFGNHRGKNFTDN